MDEVNNKKKILILFVAIIAFVVVMASGTYAWLSITGAFVSSNGNTMATCFMVDEDYVNEDGTTNLGGTLIPSSKPKRGLSGTVGMKINASCGIVGVGHIYLMVNDETDSVLYQKAPARCENKKTLEVMDFYSSSDCTSNDGTWVAANTHSALKYAVYEENRIEPVSVGYIDSPGDITLLQNIELSYTNKIHNIYIWLDGNLIDNSYIGASFDGYIHLGANQSEEHPTLTGEAYAIYSATDNSLRFYRSETPITVGSTYRGRSVTEVYTGFETAYYEDETYVPWYSITSSFSLNFIIFEDTIVPVSTAWWFREAVVQGIDLTNLDVSNVTNMEWMFDTFEGDIRGIENWDTSNVTNMSGMFNSEWIIFNDDLDLSGWNVCKVTEYTDFSNSESIIEPNFGNPKLCHGDLKGEAYAVYSADDDSLRFYRSETPITAGNTYRGRTVTNVYTGFETAYYDDETFVPWYSHTSSGLGAVVFEDVIAPLSTSSWFSDAVVQEMDLTNLNVSNVTDMGSMFAHSMLELDLSSWDVSNVTNMSGMFYGIYTNALDLSGWDTSNVTDMSSMFAKAGISSSLNGLENWDTSNVTDMEYMFFELDYSIGGLDLSNWNVCNVTNSSNFASSFTGSIVEPHFNNSTLCAGDIRTYTLTINTTENASSNYMPISLYINGVKQYTTRTSYDETPPSNLSATYYNVYEAYIVAEVAGIVGYGTTTVNGVTVFSRNTAIKTQYNLLSLGTDVINIQTQYAD